MILEWFNAREASQAGNALADKLAPSAARIHDTSDSGSDKALREIVGQAGVEIRALKLNFFKRAKLTNSLKWRLMEKGVAPSVADFIAKSLLMSLSGRIYRTISSRTRCCSKATNILRSATTAEP
jgi:hypothetical protein